MTSAPAVAVVVLAYGDEPLLRQAVEAVLTSTGITVELVVVDNGCTSDAVSSLAPDPRLTVITPGTNLGFAGGVNLGAAASSADGPKGTKSSSTEWISRIGSVSSAARATQSARARSIGSCRPSTPRCSGPCIRL